jgi:WD40 repeat protein
MSQRNPLPLGWMPRKLPVLSAEWVAPRAGRLSLWVGQCVLVVMLVAGSAMFYSEALSEQSVDNSESVAMRPQMQPVEGVAFSPDGKTLASCGWDNKVRLWDVSRLSKEPPSEPVVLPHDSMRYAVAFSADGTLLAAAGYKSLTIWTCTSGRYKPLLEEVNETSRCVAFSADGRTLAIGTDNGSIRLLDMPGGHERAVLRGHDGIVRSVAFSPDARRLVSTSEGRSIMLWDAKNGIAVGPLQLDRAGYNMVLFAAFSADGRHVAVGEASSEAEDVTLLDSETGQVSNRLIGHDSGVQALAFSPDGRTLATAGQDRSIKLWDWAHANPPITLNDGVGLVKSLAFSHDGALLAFGGDDQALRVWDVAHRKSLVVGRFPRPNSDVAGIDPVRGSAAEPSLAISKRGFSG